MLNCSLVAPAAARRSSCSSSLARRSSRDPLQLVASPQLARRLARAQQLARAPSARQLVAARWFRHSSRSSPATCSSSVARRSSRSSSLARCSSVAHRSSRSTLVTLVAARSLAASHAAARRLAAAQWQDAAHAAAQRVDDVLVGIFFCHAERADVLLGVLRKTLPKATVFG